MPFQSIWIRAEKALAIEVDQMVKGFGNPHFCLPGNLRQGIKGSVLTFDTSPIVSARKGAMAKRLRVEFVGAVYHLMNRGDRREDIARYDQDRE